MLVRRLEQMDQVPADPEAEKRVWDYTSRRRSYGQKSIKILLILKGNAKFIENIHSINKMAKRDWDQKI